METGRKSMTLQTGNNSESNISSKRLSVQVSLTGLSFLVSDGHTGTPLDFKEIDFDRAQTPESLLIKLQQELSDGYHPEQFESVNLLYANSEYTVVPASLFDETKASDYLKFNSKILSNDFVAFDRVERADLCVVYIPFVNINNYLFEQFGSFGYYHASTLLLDKLRGHSSLRDETQVQINVLSDRFDMIVWNKDRLLMCNSYPYASPEDFIYYIVFGFEQLSLDPDSVPVVLMGDISESGPGYEIAYKYIRNLSFHSFDDRFDSIDGMQGHAYPALKLL